MSKWDEVTVDDLKAGDRVRVTYEVTMGGLDPYDRGGFEDSEGDFWFTDYGDALGDRKITIERREEPLKVGDIVHHHMGQSIYEVIAVCPVTESVDAVRLPRGESNPVGTLHQGNVTKIGRVE